MKQVKLIVRIAIVLITICGYSQNNTLPPIIDRAIFFDNPEISGAQLSPDGKFISFIKTYKGTRNIWVKKSEAAFTDAKPITEDTLRPIRNYFWSRNGKYVLYSQDKGGDENFNLYAVDPSEHPEKGKSVPYNKDLTNLKGVRVIIYSIPKSNPDEIFIGLNDKDEAWHDLYKLKISTGEKTLIYQNSAKDRITGWVFDWDDKLQLATRSNDDGSNDILRMTDKSFETIYSTTPFEEATPYSFDKSNKNIYIVTNKGSENNLTKLILLNPATLKEEFIEKDPLNKVDIDDVSFSEITKEIIYTSYNNQKKIVIGKTKLMRKIIKS